MKRPRPDDVILRQMAAALRLSDPHLAGRLTGPAHLRKRSQEIAVTVLAVAALLGGLPLTLASPPWGCTVCISGFLALTAITFVLTRRYRYWRWLSIRRLRQSTPDRRAGAGT